MGFFSSKCKISTDYFCRKFYDQFVFATELHGMDMWLLSDAAKFVTGVVVPVDGGFSAFSGV